MKFIECCLLNIRFILFLLFLNIKYIKGSKNPCENCVYSENRKKCATSSECSEQNCECPSNCKPHFKGECYDCSDALGSYSPLNFYSINAEGKCIIGSSGNITIDNNEIVGECSPYFYFGDFCYPQCPANQNMKSKTDEKQCECKENYKLLIDDILGKSYHRCVSSCPYGYNEDNQCYERIPETHYTYPNKTCVGTCSLYIHDNKYCLEKCPDSAPFYKITGNKKECISSCGDKYYFSDTKQCFGENDNCNNYISFIDYQTNTFICNKNEGTISDSYVCPSDFPYRYGSSCIRNCSDTTRINNKVTYSLIKGNEDSSPQKKICVEDCGEGFFLDPSTLSCYKNCKETSNKFHKANDKKCYKNCSSINPSLEYYNDETFECVESCTDGRYKSIPDKVCYSTIEGCYKNSLKSLIYIDPDKKECMLSCNKYILKTTQDGGIVYYCLDSCSTKYKLEGGVSEQTNNYYSKKEDKVCIQSCENDLYYKYKPSSSYNEYSFICFKSCKDISADYKYEYDYICYKNAGDITGTKQYFYEKDGITKYKSIESETQMEFCSKVGYYYLKKGNTNECVKDCGDSDYKVFYKLNNEGTIVEFGKCLETCDTDSVYRYYSSETGSDRICRKECLKKKIVVSSNSNIPAEGTCVSECPTNFYESIDGNSCLESCQFYIEKDNGKKKCVPDCKSISKYFFKDKPLEGIQVCIDECKNNIGNFIYYNPENNECIDDCKPLTTSNNFALKAENSHQPCLNSCPKRFEYYFDTEKICLSKCLKTNGELAYVKEPTSKVCVDQCANNEYIINGNICTTNKCSKDEQYYKKNELPNGDINYKCQIKCDNNEKYIKRSTETDAYNVYECLNSCDMDYYLYGNKCLDKCPDEMFYSNENPKQCKLKCVNPDDKYEVSTDDNGKKYTCKSICSGDKPYINSNNECVADCPIEEKFIGNDNKCKNYCEESDGLFYYKFKTIENNGIYYDVYKCIRKCDEDEGPDKYKYNIDGTKECIKECPEEKPYLLDNTCYSICLNNPIYPFSVTKIEGSTKTHTCGQKCSGDIKYFGEDKICIESCSIFEYNKYHNEKENDFSCVSHCDLKSEYRFSYSKTENEVEKFYCLNKCKDDKKYYTQDDYVCDSQCHEPNKYLITTQNMCADKCPMGQVANPTTSEDDKKVSEYKCEFTCNAGTYYYESERICGKCKDNHYIIQGTQKCIEFCDEINSSNKYYYYEPSSTPTSTQLIKSNMCVTECPEDKPFADFNNHCSDRCTSEAYKYYKPSDRICMNKCPDGTKINDNICVENCPINKVLDTITNMCLDDCSQASKNYVFYYQNERKCLKECNEGDFLYKNGNKYKCMKNCSNINEDKDIQLYIDGNNCVTKCPETKRFFVSQSTYGEIEISKYCYTDCPIGYEFYNDNSECFGKCDKYYITNKDPNVNGKKCVEKCSSPNEYIYIHDTNLKECLELCPSDRIFYEETTDGKICYETCPKTSPYHIKGNFQCKDYCDSGYSNYATGECVSGCEMNQFWAEEKLKNDKTMTICYDNCNQTAYAKFSTFEKNCVSECSNNDPNLKGNLETGECECRGLFFYNEDGTKTCIDPQKKYCTELDTNYKIQVNGTNQCTDICYGVLSVDEDVCYWGPAESINCPINSVKGIFKGIIKCQCEYGYYYNLQKKMVCLDKNLKCPDYKYFNTDTKECVQSCEELFLLDNKCYSNCPTGMIGDTSEKTCKCVYKFYKVDDNKFVCLDKDDQCPAEYPYLIEEAKECVKECSSAYPIVNDMKCFSECPANYMRIKDPTNELKYICICKYKWYYKNEDSVCLEENNQNKCEALDENMDLKYFVIKTKQCVSSCKGDYKYFFNKECYYDCSEVANLKQNPKSNSNECICKEKWRYKDNGDKECIDECDSENEYLIKETNQCIKKTSKCSFEKPILWNNLCYDKCPDNTEEDTIKGKTCKCKYNWFTRDDGLIECMGEKTDCPYTSHPYLIAGTKECVKNIAICTENNKFIYNFVCYDECPSNTSKPTDGTNNNCECNPEDGYWNRKKDEYGRDILQCGLPNCKINNEIKKYDNETKECVSSCEEISKYLYLDVCYSTCPPLTVQVTNRFNCKLSNEFEEKDLSDLLQNVENKIKEINENIPSGGLVINNEENEATMQIYRLDKDEQKNKEAIMRSNLAYIDISQCIDKIRESNNMGDDEQVVVVKLDLKSKDKKMIVDPVEYEFFNSKTEAKLDASVCGRNELVISYPLTYFLKNKRKLRVLDDAELIEISDKFERGKLLYEKDNSIDSFNYNSTIYSNICYPIEVNGKDLTLENRISYFYPNYSLCESSCVYDYTNFAEERIYCNCSIKLKLDLEREQGIKYAEFNKEETDNNQMGPTNLPVLTCFTKVKVTRNPAFYLSVVLLAIEIGMIFVIHFQGISSLYKYIKFKLFKNDTNSVEDELQIDPTFKENNLNDSGRNLENPPKKNVQNSKDNEKEDKKKIKAKGKPKKLNVMQEKKKFDNFSEANNSEEYNNYLKKNEIDIEKGFFFSIQKEEKYLRKNFSESMTKDKYDSVVVVLTSIFDKIYFAKILFLSDRGEIVSVMFSLYLLCHMLLLTFSAFFFDIKTIHKIFENEDYPNLGYYLLYGFLGNLIVWAIFRLFSCLVANNNKLRKLFARTNGNALNMEKKMRKFNRLIGEIKRNIVIYLVIQFILILFCSFYLITFCGIYTGTKTKLFLAYGFAVIEIIIIKCFYGLVLGVLRKISLYAEKRSLYNFVLVCNKYLS